MAASKVSSSCRPLSLSCAETNSGGVVSGPVLASSTASEKDAGAYAGPPDEPDTWTTVAVSEKHPAAALRMTKLPENVGISAPNEKADGTTHVAHARPGASVCDAAQPAADEGDGPSDS